MTTSALKRHRVLLIVIGSVLAVVAGLSAWDTIDEALLPAAEPAKSKPAVDGVSGLNVLTFNVWHGGTQIRDGSQAIADIIVETDADVTFMPEVGRAPARVGKLLGYENYMATDTGIVSRYPILSSTPIGSWWSKAIIDVNGTEVAVYGGHLEYRWYTTYLPRG